MLSNKENSTTQNRPPLRVLREVLTSPSVAKGLSSMGVSTTGRMEAEASFMPAASLRISVFVDIFM